MPDSVRANPEALGRLVIGKAADRVTLAEIANINLTQGRSSIWREDFTRFVAVKFNVRGRDLGSTVDEARRFLVTSRTAGVKNSETKDNVVATTRDAADLICFSAHEGKPAALPAAKPAPMPATAERAIHSAAYAK